MLKPTLYLLRPRVFNFQRLANFEADLQRFLLFLENLSFVPSDSPPVFSLVLWPPWPPLGDICWHLGCRIGYVHISRWCPRSGQLVVVRKSTYFLRMLLPPAWEEGFIHSPFVICPMKMHDEMRLWYVSWQLVELMSSPWIESDSIVTLSEWRLTQCQPMTGQPVLRNRRGPVWMLEETRRPFLGAGGRCQRVPTLREEGGGYEGRIRIFLASEKGFCLLSMRLAVTIWWDWHGMGGLGIPVGCMNSHTFHPKLIFPYLNRC